MFRNEVDMYTIPPKKTLIVNILDILKKYTDEEHRLSQNEILSILEKEYSMKVDRKSIKPNLMNLIEMGYDIEYKESVKTVKNKNGEMEKVPILTDFYLNRDFTDGELRLLIDSLIFSPHIPAEQGRELIEKLEGLSNVYFKSRVKHITSIPDNMPRNNQMFYTIEILDEAISKNRKVKFKYNEYRMDKKMHPRMDASGQIREYIVNPYQIVATHGNYYLICNYDKYDDVSNYRIDRITDIELLDCPCKDMKNIKGLENGLNLPKHMAEHVYMYGGESVRVEFIAKKYLISEIFDWFGTSVDLLEQNENEVHVSAYVTKEAMRNWALQYSLHIKILSPKSLVDEIKDNLETVLGKYNTTK